MMNRERHSMKKNSGYYNHASSSSTLQSLFSPLEIQRPQNDLGLDCPTYENYGRLELQRNLAATCQWSILKKDLK